MKKTTCIKHVADGIKGNAIKILLNFLFIIIAQPLFAQNDKPLPSTKVEISFSLEGGYFNRPLEVALETSGTTIFYTTDGSLPNEQSLRYKAPINFDTTTIIRAFAIQDTFKSKVIAQTFFIKEPYTPNFPTISLAVNPDLLFDPVRGLFVAGPKAIDSLYAMPGANFWSRQELKIHTEIFDKEGRTVFNSENGMRLFGGMSRLWPQKSLAIVARDDYGKKRIRHRVFGKKGLKSFKYLVLRNSGSDWGKTHFRDGLMISLVDHWDIEKQQFQPAHVYLNGKYWGIYNIREKINKFFIEDHAGVDKENIDLIEHYMTLKKGSTQHYRMLLDFLEKSDISQVEPYLKLGELMEIDNFRRLQIAQIYFDNRDAGGNIKFWRPRTENGKWRWILFDTDWGFGLHEDNAFELNTLEFHTASDGPAWPNPPWSTFILRKLLTNKAFEKAFVNNFADHLNTSFHPDIVEAKIEDFYQLFLPEIDRHLERWNLTRKKWEEEVKLLRIFARKRNNYVWQHLEARFNTGAARKVNISTSNGGFITLNNELKIDQEGFEGKYFENYPIRIKATPNYGYKFSHWEGIEVSDAVQEFELQLQEPNYSIKAVFVPYIHPLSDKVVINEISPKSGAAGDWVEIYNKGKETAYLSNWILTDNKNEFVLPQVMLKPKEHLIICQDSSKFMEAYPNAYNVVGGMSFGLNKVRERIGLYADVNAMVDSVSYDLEPMDSLFTINLLLPKLDNGDPDNWIIRFGKGTPGSANPYYIQSRIRRTQQLWVQLGTALTIFLMLGFFLRMRHKGHL